MAEDKPIDQPLLCLSEEFMRLFALNQRRIYGFITTLLPRNPDAEEILQQTNLILWRQFDTFRPEADFAAWAFGIARNEVRRYLRDRGRKLVSLDDDVADLLAENEAERGELFNSRAAALWHCLEKLTAGDRDLVRRCYESDTTIKDVAALLGRPVNTIYKSVARIRRNLVECVRRQVAAEGRQ